MIRLLKLILGIPLVLLAVLIAVVAVVGFFTDQTTSGRVIAVFLVSLSIVLFVSGKRLIKNPSSGNSISQFAHAQTSAAFDQSFQFVTVTSRGDISVHASSAADAKLAIKELRLLKKSFSIEKQQVTAQLKAVRAQYTHDTRQRGSNFRGGGGFDRFVRSMQAASRDSARTHLARTLRPLEIEQQRIDHVITQIGSLIAQVEAQALRLP